MLVITYNNHIIIRHSFKKFSSIVKTLPHLISQKSVRIGYSKNFWSHILTATGSDSSKFSTIHFATRVLSLKDGRLFCIIYWLKLLISPLSIFDLSAARTKLRNCWKSSLYDPYRGTRICSSFKRLSAFARPVAKKNLQGLYHMKYHIKWGASSWWSFSPNLKRRTLRRRTPLSHWNK